MSWGFSNSGAGPDPTSAELREAREHEEPKQQELAPKSDPAKEES